MLCQLSLSPCAHAHMTHAVHLAAQLPGLCRGGGQLFAPQAAPLLGTPGARETAHARHGLSDLGLGVGLTGLSGLSGLGGLSTWDAFGPFRGILAPSLIFPVRDWWHRWHRHGWNPIGTARFQELGHKNCSTCDLCWVLFPVPACSACSSMFAHVPPCSPIPKCSMYGILNYIWAISGVNVDRYSIHGAYGL